MHKHIAFRSCYFYGPFPFVFVHTFVVFVRVVLQVTNVCMCAIAFYTIS